MSFVGQAAGLLLLPTVTFLVPPVARVVPAHRTVALSLVVGPRYHAIAALGEVLTVASAGATIFLTPDAAAREAPALRALIRHRQVEVGLACSTSQSLARERRRLADLLGEAPAFVHAVKPQPTFVARAYRAGMLTLTPTRVIPSAEAAPAAADVRPGDILDLRLDDGQSTATLRQLLVALHRRAFAVTSASGLLEDTRGHLETCSADAPPADHPLGPRAPLVPRLLWQLPFGERMVRRLYGLKPGVRLAGVLVAGLLPLEVEARLDVLQARLRLPPVDARIDQATGAIIPDRPGRVLDETATALALWRARPGEDVAPRLTTTYARWRTADLERLTTELSHYRTWISGGSGRYENIVKGAACINNRLLLPGEVFSTLAAIGRPSKAAGWHMAPVIVHGDFVPGYGGGLCQVSSTLYNAVARAGLEIVERHHHARAVHYVPPGRDATIAWPSLDFRFRNDRRTPILLRAYVRGGALHMAVLGDPRG